MEKPPDEPDDQQIEKRQSEDNIQTGQDVLSKMVAPKGFKALKAEGKAAVVKLFSNLQSAHENLANMAGSIVHLGTVSSPDQFSYILPLAICPLIQLKLPPELCAPSEMRFEKERLTPEESFEEQCLNIVLPAAIPGKHLTCCLATTTHLLCKRMFNNKVSQATIAREFGVENKKLHMAISARKYDASKKPSCKRAPYGDKDKMDKTIDKPLKCKATPTKKKAKDQEPPQREVTEIWDTEVVAATSKMDTEEEPLDSDDDCLPDPFPPSQPKQFESMNPADIPKKPCSN